MSLAIAILCVAVILVFGLWTRAVQSAAQRAYPSDRKSQHKWTWIGIAVFFSLVAIDLGLAESGLLSQFDSFPPPFGVFFLVMVIGASFAIAASPLGRMIAHHTSFAKLVGFHFFRIFAEALLTTAFHAGLAPRHLTLEGWNFDIITGITAVIVFFILRTHVSRTLVWIWNLMGMVFLFIIAFIAIMSMPTSFRMFLEEPSNIWVTTVPFILLPGLLVTAALTGHLLILRKLLSPAAQDTV
jgi:hypothetical protein